MWDVFLGGQNFLSVQIFLGRIPSFRVISFLLSPGFQLFGGHSLFSSATSSSHLNFCRFFLPFPLFHSIYLTLIFAQGRFRYFKNNFVHILNSRVNRWSPKVTLAVRFNFRNFPSWTLFCLSTFQISQTDWAPCLCNNLIRCSIHPAEMREVHKWQTQIAKCKPEPRRISFLLYCERCFSGNGWLFVLCACHVFRGKPTS